MIMITQTYKRLSFAAFLAIGLLGLSSCGSDELSPGIEYMPDMYRTPAREPYAKNEMPVEGTNTFSDNMESKLPPEGTIPMDYNYLPYGIPNNNEGYQMAGELLKNPFPANEEIVAEGKVIYSKFCVQCHGKTGMGDGPTVAAGHPPPPAYSSASLKNLPEGKMFHTITYGKNLMGSHASQLNNEERWKVIRYVQTLQNPDGEKEEKSDESESTESASDTTSTAEGETAMLN